MAVNKKADFPPELLELSEFARAISHPARLAILQTLAEKNSCICGEIVEVLPLAQATVSQHLRELKDAGLIKGEIDGKKSCYCIDQNKLTELSAKLLAMFGTLMPGKCC